MGPGEQQLRQWCRRYERSARNLPALRGVAQKVYLCAVGSLAVQMGEPPDCWEDVMSEAIEAAEALGL